MTDIQKKILIAGIKIKIERGELLEDILTSYVKLNDDEKQQVRTELEA